MEQKAEIAELGAENSQLEAEKTYLEQIIEDEKAENAEHVQTIESMKKSDELLSKALFENHEKQKSLNK